MAEAEEVLTDAARHATVFAQRLWQRYRPAPPAAPMLSLEAVAERLDLLLLAVLGQPVPLRVAQPPARATWLARCFGRSPRPYRREAVPATDGRQLWLPRGLGVADQGRAAVLYKAMALHQAMRIRRGSAQAAWRTLPPLAGALYQLFEAYAAECDLLRELPGCAADLQALRAECLARRPPLSAFGPARRGVEHRVRALLAGRAAGFPVATSPADSMALAMQLLEGWPALAPGDALGDEPLFADFWTGCLLEPAPERCLVTEARRGEQSDTPPRSARLARRPEVRQAHDEERQADGPGPLMIQLDEPHPHAEDPLGLQRPIDRDDGADAELYGELLGELPRARLVSSPGQPREVLLSDDPPEPVQRPAAPPGLASAQGCVYPEWDHRTGRYAEHGATVRPGVAQAGSEAWVAQTLEAHRGMLAGIRRRFELLRARRVWLRAQVEGDELDVDAYVDAAAAMQAGQGLSDRLYQANHAQQRDLAILVLIDVSGSTDSWVSQGRRVIDVEREALLLLCIALQGLGSPYAVQAFSGQGRDAVSVRELKGFDEAYSQSVALRIAALEPEHYTRCGAAIRHASTALMAQPAAHRLLLVLSDGKPSDEDQYAGPYGVEDSRQAVLEATLQGISPFCLTIDRQAGAYLPRMFGASRYALLPRPDLLPTVLLDWMRRLLLR